MTALLIIYNIHDDKRRNQVHSLITAAQHIALSESAYLIVTQDSQRTAYLALRPYIVAADDLIVSLFDPETFGWHRHEVVDWVNRFVLGLT